MERVPRSEGNRMVEELYSDRTMGMEITTMMMTKREFLGLKNNNDGMFW